MSRLPPIAELLPHEGPAVMLDALTDYSLKSATCTAHIAADSPYLRDGTLPVAVTVEHMAQAVAAMAGAEARLRGDPVRLGFLVGCREMIIRQPSLPVGAQLEIRVQCVWRSEAMGNFDCSVRVEGVEVAVATLSVATPPPGQT